MTPCICGCLPTICAWKWLNRPSAPWSAMTNLRKPTSESLENAEKSVNQDRNHHRRVVHFSGGHFRHSLQLDGGRPQEGGAGSRPPRVGPERRDTSDPDRQGQRGD